MAPGEDDGGAYRGRRTQVAEDAGRRREGRCEGTLGAGRRRERPQAAGGRRVTEQDDTKAPGGDEGRRQVGTLIGAGRGRRLGDGRRCGSAPEGDADRRREITADRQGCRVATGGVGRGDPPAISEKWWGSLSREVDGVVEGCEGVWREGEWREEV
jgi:hypothetical protein